MIGHELHPATIAEFAAIFVFPAERLYHRKAFRDGIFCPARKDGEIAGLRLLAGSRQRTVEQRMPGGGQNIAGRFLVGNFERQACF